MSETYQSGVKPERVEWVAETTEGVTPDDPSWNLFSDNLVSGPAWGPDANTTRIDASGTATAAGFFNGSETHDVTITYWLQQWYTSGDPGIDFLEPDADNSLKNTHSIVYREEHASGGTDDAGRRIYTVIKGAHPDSLTAPFEVEDGSPIEQELTYQAEKVRQYDISQPSAGTTLDVENKGTTSVDVIIEDEDANTTFDDTVAGGSTVTTTETFEGIDAVELSTDTDGDLVVSDGDGTTFVTIKGSDSYPAGEGDLGVPALGSGSHASAIGTDYIRFLDDELTIPNVESDIEIISGEMSVETGIESNAKLGSASQNIHSTNWTYEVTATLAGSKVSVDQTTNYLTETTGDIVWTAQEGDITFSEAFIQSPGEYTKEADNGKLQMDNSFEAETITVV